MIRAAIVGMGRWGQNLVECTQGKTDKIRFTVGVARTPEKAKAFAAAHGLRLVSAYEAVLADPDVDAVVGDQDVRAAAEDENPRVTVLRRRERVAQHAFIPRLDEVARPTADLHGRVRGEGNVLLEMHGVPVHSLLRYRTPGCGAGEGSRAPATEPQRAPRPEEPA